MTEPVAPGALDGVTILDFTQLLQGPVATQVLADFGARVIKIENSGLGDIGRRQGITQNGMSYHWAANNRNKECVSVDLKSPDGLAIVRELVASADVVTSNFRPGVMEKLALGHEELAAINPRIISAFASGYGRTGPYRHRRGQDLALQAMGGFLALTGHAETGPVPAGTWIVDYIAGMQFAIGILTALAARERTGRGQVVDTSLLNASVAVHFQEGTEFLNTAGDFPRPISPLAHAHQSALYGVYETAEGRHVALVGEYYVDRQWWRVASALGEPDEVTGDPRLQTVAGVIEHEHEAVAILRAAFARHSLDDAIARLEEHDVLATPVNGYPEVFADPQVLHNGLIAETTHEVVGTLRLVGPPIALSETPATVRTAPRLLGEDNIAILRELGYDDDRIARLHADGVLGGVHRGVTA
ncbi:CoA transferase [Microbacterium betulae]|uniref:CoA transferase n=1 Tax=Microbacterium betulae TaxID=2981139 RepID=A0AA97FGN9_9MICO|nr:CoA transferase [Microbacterium sp. AB]WOF22558.1 CoA transferase [Microbacterium sp. AB]